MRKKRPNLLHTKFLKPFFHRNSSWGGRIEPIDIPLESPHRALHFWSSGPSSNFYSLSRNSKISVIPRLSALSARCLAQNVWVDKGIQAGSWQKKGVVRDAEWNILQLDAHAANPLWKSYQSNFKFSNNQWQLWQQENNIIIITDQRDHDRRIFSECSNAGRGDDFASRWDRGWWWPTITTPKWHLNTYVAEWLNTWLLSFSQAKKFR